MKNFNFGCEDALHERLHKVKVRLRKLHLRQNTRDILIEALTAWVEWQEDRLPRLEQHAELAEQEERSRQDAESARHLTNMRRAEVGKPPIPPQAW